MNPRNKMNATDPEYPMIAIILVAYGGRDDTLDCIESLKKSDYPNILIILVDNASPDNTSEAVSDRFPDVKIIKSEQNLGFAGGNNLGIDYALKKNSDYVFLLNNDTVIDPVTISELVKTAKETEKLGAMGPLIYYYDKKDLIWSAGGRINFRWSYLEHIGLRQHDKGQYNQITEVDYLTGCALFIPAARFNETEKLDHSYWMYYEDADYCMKLKNRGYRIIFNPHGKVWHKISSSTGGNLSIKKMWLKFKNGFRFFMRHSNSPFWSFAYPISQFVIYLRARKSAKV